MPIKRAEFKDKSKVVEILTESFDQNLSVNYIIKQGKDRKNRIRALMNYSFDKCAMFGDVWVSSDGHSCALALYPESKNYNFKSIWLDIKLIFTVMGPTEIIKVLRRESLIKKKQENVQMYYLWFIGVALEHQNKGIGNQLLSDVIEHAVSVGRPLYLETSTPANLSWYKKFDFQVYDKLELGYNLYFLKRVLAK